jgi:hypothetical protein
VDDDMGMFGDVLSFAMDIRYQSRLNEMAACGKMKADVVVAVIVTTTPADNSIRNNFLMMIADDDGTAMTVIAMSALLMIMID